MKIFTIFVITISFLFAFGTNHFPFDKTKLSNYHKDMDLSNYIGIVSNQIWVTSKKLSKENLELFIKKKYNVKIVTYHKIYGLLIEFNYNTNEQIKDIIEQLKKNPKLDNVYYRVYDGKNSAQIISQ
jgi:hypothetical protein